MSGGSFDYLYSRVEDEITEPVTDIDRMADDLEGRGYMVVAGKTRAIAHMLRDARAAAFELLDLWHAVEWHRSNDWGPASVRREAVKLGEPLPACLHTDKRNAYGHREGSKRGDPLTHFLSCEECGAEFEVTP